MYGPAKNSRLRRRSSVKMQAQDAAKWAKKFVDKREVR
jgi:hypothetical protein